VRQLQPWFENLGKRQVKSSKVYVRDSGLLHTLLGIDDQRQLLMHPKSGASWEGFALETILSLLQPRQAYFWATHEGAELDLMVLLGGRRVGFELKRADAVRPTKSIAIAQHDLALREVFFVHPGSGVHSLTNGVFSVGFQDLESALARKKLLPKRH